MTQKLYIDTLTEKEIVELEKRLRPGASSMHGFLGDDERLKDIIYSDAETLEGLGITHTQIADRLEQAITHQLDSEGYIIKSIGYRGWQDDPFNKGATRIESYSSQDFTVTNPLGEELKFPGLIVTLIRNYQFFEGKGTSYRVDPSDAIRILDIKPGEDYSKKINSPMNKSSGSQNTVYRD
jgi:hypothetical protein